MSAQFSSGPHMCIHNDEFMCVYIFLKHVRGCEHLRLSRVGVHNDRVCVHGSLCVYMFFFWKHVFLGNFS